MILQLLELEVDWVKMMNNTEKKRGSVWRCISPLLIYLVLLNLVSIVVMFVYYAKQGFFGMTDIALEELMDCVISATLEDMGILNFISMLVGEMILIPIFLRMHKKDRKRDEMDQIGISRKKAPAALYLILAAAGMASCLAASNMISMSGLVETSESYSTAVNILYSGGMIAELLFLSVIAPVMEELLFRGLIYSRIKEFTPVIPAMIWASLVFALLHGNLVQGIYAFVMGFLLCYVYERYNSLAAPVLMHISSNLIAVIASETGMLDFMYNGIGAFYGSTFVCCVIVIAMIYLIELYVRPITEKQEN